MRRTLWTLAPLLLTAPLGAVLSAQDRDVVAPTPNCPSCAEWNAPHEPVRLFGNTYYVGTGGLTALLVTSPAGHILIDGGLPESAPLIRRNIEALGFKIGDVRVIVNSHAHNDHAGGIAMLARLSGATVAASAPSARWMKAGRGLDDDPQVGLNAPYPEVARVRVLHDGEQLTVGPLTLTAHFTGGHTPGGTTWSWRSCADGTCLSFVYADSQSPISNDTFRYSDNRSYPHAVADFRRGHGVIERLSCDVLVTPHPAASKLWERLSQGALQNPQACRDYAAAARRSLDQRLTTERK